jgi:hypothetical protein
VSSTKADRLASLAHAFEFEARSYVHAQEAVANTRHLIEHGSRQLYTDEGLAADLEERQGWVRKWRDRLISRGHEIAQEAQS